MATIVVDTQCVFCKILRGEIASSVVYENDFVIAFMDIRPVNKGHLLVVPKQHRPSMNDLSEEEAQNMFPIAQKMNKALRAIAEQGELTLEGINLYLADGEAAGQEVFHAHLHVIPRFKKDGYKLRIDYKLNGYTNGGVPQRYELDQLAEQLKQQMQQM